MLSCRFKSKRLTQSYIRYSHDDHGDHHGDHNSTGWPKATGREPLKPFDRQQVSALLKAKPGVLDGAAELEGWLFGKKVFYLNPDRPYYEQIPENAAYLFGEKPLPPGYKRYMQDWEILSLSLVITFFTMLAITWWAKPETDKNIWAREELREREILKLKEYVHLRSILKLISSLFWSTHFLRYEKRGL